MDKQQLNEIITCLPRGRTLFHYFRDRYALMLLRDYVGEGKLISEIKGSAFARLLDKPRIKAVLGRSGQTMITSVVLDSLWPEDTKSFLLTLSRWGENDPDWDQTSRLGYNLVLQLNFSKQHDKRYRALVKPSFDQYLNIDGHPVMRRGRRKLFRETLAWSRIDLDFNTDEALIEEIQSDWIRDANHLLFDANWCKSKGEERISWRAVEGKVDDIIDYCQNILDPYRAIWDEAMLAATIGFIKHELGIKNIYYHSASTGYRVKRIRYWQPPRSLYSVLPRRFCFERTAEAPIFLKHSKHFRRVYRKIRNPQWFHMAI